MQSKNVVQSTSAWGAVLLIIPIAFQLFGAPLSAQEIEQLQGAGVALDSAVMHIITIVGTIQMIVGRFNARQPLHLLPGRQFVLNADGTRTLVKKSGGWLSLSAVALPEDVKRKIEQGG